MTGLNIEQYRSEASVQDHAKYYDHRRIELRHGLCVSLKACSWDRAELWYSGAVADRNAYVQPFTTTIWYLYASLTSMLKARGALRLSRITRDRPLDLSA